MRVAIIADDLTGACDTGAAFAPHAEVLLEGAPSTRVAVYTTDSRNLSPEAAAARVQTLAAGFSGSGVILYKKIDSMLRGNAAAECSAIGRELLICPAFPAQGRVVVDGWAEPAHIDLRAMFPHAEVRDASTHAGLLRLAETALKREPPPVLVGSAGLARALAQVLGYACPAVSGEGRGTAILCIGSSHPATLTQLDHLARAAPGPFQMFRLDPYGDWRPVWEQVRRCLQAPGSGGLLLSGGDTARHCCRLMDVRTIRLEGEVLPGIPMGRLAGGSGHGLAVVTKSGGFGREDALTCAVRVLSGQTRMDAS